jgi:predicted metal-dependent phosphoesterase TrpH
MTQRHHLRTFRCLATVLCLCSAALLVSAARADDSARWYKGNTHCHTLWSDGDEFPEMVADWYKSHGYDFLAISDHDRFMAGEKWVSVDHGDRSAPASVVEKCRKRFGQDWLEVRGPDNNRQVKLKTFAEVCAKLGETGKFLLIQNEEISSGVGDHSVHINAINLAEPITRKSGKNVVDTISLNLDMVQEQAGRLGRPMFAQVNHPNWSDYDISPEDLAAAAAAKFFEICNGHPGTRNRGDATHPGVERLWDIANTLRIAKMKAPPLYGVGADDAHNYQQFTPSSANPNRAWIMVHARQLNADALIDAINRGDFYASTGVTLRSIAYDAQQRTITVEVQSEPGIHYTIEFIGTLKGVDPAGQLVDAVAGQPSKRPGHKYSAEVGKVLSRVQGVSATYRLTGDELYVRAAVRSDKPVPNVPVSADQQQEAWCQPVGWEK